MNDGSCPAYLLKRVPNLLTFTLGDIHASYLTYIYIQSVHNPPARGLFILGTAQHLDQAPTTHHPRARPLLPPHPSVVFRGWPPNMVAQYAARPSVRACAARAATARHFSAQAARRQQIQDAYIISGSRTPTAKVCGPVFPDVSQPGTTNG